MKKKATPDGHPKIMLDLYVRRIPRYLEEVDRLLADEAVRAAVVADRRLVAALDLSLHRILEALPH